MGIKSIPIEAFPPGYWRILEGKSDNESPISVQNAFKSVPVLRSAVELRANAISSLPYAIYRGDVDVTQDTDIVNMMRMLRPLLRKIELNLCLFGSAYLLIEKNRFGLNTKMRSLLPQSIRPKYDVQQGLVGFTRVIGNDTYTLALDDVIYFWVDNIDAETGPGTSPAETAIRSSATLYFLDTFLENFWKRGAIKATLLTVNGPAQQAEMEKLETWWKKFVGGVRNAWNSVAIRADVKPVVVGDTLKDTVNPDLTEQSKTDVLTALGVPHSLVLSNAATYATANVDRLGFYENTIVPQAMLICDALNEQLFSKRGIRIMPKPDKLETYQRNEIDKAQGVIQLTGSPILTVNEARDMMGYGPIDQAPMNINDKFDTPEEIINATAPQYSDTASLSTNDTGVPSQKSQQNIDLSNWRTKSIKSLRSGKSADVKFTSDTLPYDDQQIIHELLSTASHIDDVHAVFHGIKQIAGENITESEQMLYDALVKAMTKIKSQAKAQGKELNPVEYAQLLANELANTLTAQLPFVYEQKIAMAIREFGIGIDPIVLANRLTVDWNDYLQKRKTQIADTTRRYLDTILAVPSQITDGMLDVAFGNRRAEVITITEQTNMDAMVVMKIKEIINESSSTKVDIFWVTAADETVCAQCKSYNQKPQSVWNVPPPAHPYCRCSLELRRI